MGEENLLQAHAHHMNPHHAFSQHPAMHHHHQAAHPQQMIPHHMHNHQMSQHMPDVHDGYRKYGFSSRILEDTQTNMTLNLIKSEAPQSHYLCNPLEHAVMWTV